MIYPNPDKLDTISSKYALVIVAAKRARQIKDKARTFVSPHTNPLTTALEELAYDHIVPLQVGEPEKLPETVSLTPVLSGLVSLGVSDDIGHKRDARGLEALMIPPDEMLDEDDEHDDLDHDGPKDLHEEFEAAGFSIDDPEPDADAGETGDIDTDADEESDDGSEV